MKGGRNKSMEGKKEGEEEMNAKGQKERVLKGK
jgi:hypothetical protein